MLSTAGAALADTAPVSGRPGASWADPAHTSPFELLVSRIASRIAGHTVSIRCETPEGWASAIDAAGGNPNAEDGSVSAGWNSATGTLTALPDVAELNGERVCGPLERFAAATVKPTTCLAAAGGTADLLAVSHARARRALEGGLGMPLDTRSPARQPGPCYLGAGTTAAALPTAFWVAYGSYAVAILTLTHESIHLSGVVGGTLPGGLEVGDPQAEAKANCYGMQWMSYAATRLGDTPADAHAIARYYWENIYPQARTAGPPGYWSASCVPGGALDLHLPQAAGWS